MLAVVSLLTVITIALTITRVATIVLTNTGLSREVARFQARSAFSGAGFTTTESEDVVNHPVRRRVISTLVLLGSAGIVTTVTSLLLSFSGADGGQAANRIVVILLGLLALRLLAGSALVDRAVTRATQWALRRYTTLAVRDYEKLLHITDDYTVAEIDVADGHWLAERRLDELSLRQEGIIVLGVYRQHGRYVGVPVGPVRVHVGDRLVVYGEDARIQDLTARPAGADGDRAHAEAVARYAALRTQVERDDAQH